VNVHLSEEEQVEALKKWWKENGKSVVAGVVIGLAGVFGWQAWTQKQQATAEQASALFEQMNRSLAMGAAAQAEQQAKSIIQDYQGTTYAVFAAFELARIKVEQGDSAAARAQLQWALDKADDNSLKQIARLRMARLLLSDGDADGAAASLAGAPADGYKAELAELRGDIAVAKGDLAAARQAYQEALDARTGSTSVVQMKLDDLATSVSDS